MLLADDLTEADVERWARSASPLHSNGDAMGIAVHDGRIAGVRGRVDDRVNRGRLDPKDLFGWQANNSPERLTRPLLRRNGRLLVAGAAILAPGGGFYWKARRTRRSRIDRPT